MTNIWLCTRGRRKVKKRLSQSFNTQPRGATDISIYPQAQLPEYKDAFSKCSYCLFVFFLIKSNVMTYKKGQSGIYCVNSNSLDRLISVCFPSWVVMSFEDQQMRVIHNHSDSLFQCLEFSMLSSLYDEWRFEEEIASHNPHCIAFFIV